MVSLICQLWLKKLGIFLLKELDEPMSFTIDDLYPSSLVAFFSPKSWRRPMSVTKVLRCKWVCLSFIEEGNKKSIIYVIYNIESLISIIYDIRFIGYMIFSNND